MLDRVVLVFVIVSLEKLKLQLSCFFLPKLSTVASDFASTVASWSVCVFHTIHLK